MSDYVVKFIKDREYRRFLVTGALTANTNGMIAIDFYEETFPLLTKYSSNNQGNASFENEEGNLINYYHACALIHPNQLPGLINSLQTALDRYNQEQEKREGE